MKKVGSIQVIDLFAEKVDALVPGFIKDERIKEFRSLIVEWTDGKEKVQLPYLR